MNVLSPVSTIMSTDLLTVNPQDPIAKVKSIFDDHAFHHLPVVKHNEIVGIISKSDLLLFLHGFPKKKNAQFLENERLQKGKAEEIMTDKLAKVGSKEPIRTLVDIFKLNWFHAIPVVDDGKLVGIVTTHDIIKKLSEDPIKLEDYQTA